MKQPIDFFSGESARAGLKGKTVKGAAVTGITQAVRVGVGLATIPLLARLLDPEDFGLVATVAILTNFAAMFVDAGLSMATVQRDEITKHQISNLFWIATALGLAITLVVSSLGPVLGWLYGEPRLVLLTVVTSLSYIFTGLTIQHQALLRRCMLFNRLAVVEIISLVAGQAIALFWAWTHFQQTNDYWALAFIPLVTAATRMIGIWLVCPWIPELPRRGSDAGEMIRFGGNLTSGQAFNYMSANVDLLVVGYFFGERLLGNYERSAMLALQPVRQVNGPLTAVCVPALSRLVSSPEKYFHAFRTATTIIGMVMVPIAAACIVAPDLLVTAFLGPGWEAAVPIFRALAFGLIALPICNSSAWLLISQGRGGEMFRFQATDAIAKVALVFCAIPWGVLGVAVACSLRSLAIPLFLFWLVGRTGPVSARRIWLLYCVQLLSLAATASVLLVLRVWSEHSGLNVYESTAMTLVAAFAVSTTVFSCFSFVRTGLTDVLQAFHRLQPVTS